MERFKITLKKEMNAFVEEFCKELEDKLRAIMIRQQEQRKDFASYREKCAAKANRRSSSAC